MEPEEKVAPAALLRPCGEDGATEGTEASAKGQVGQVSAKKAAWEPKCSL